MKNLLIACCSIFLLSAAEPKLITQKMVDGISAGMPKDFVPMSDDDIANKYPSTKKPVAMFTNLDRTVDFGLNISKSRWGGADLNLLKDIFHATIVQSYDSVTFMKEDVITINGRPYVRYEFNSLFDNTQGYHYLLISVLTKTLTEAETDKETLTPGNSNHLLIFNFYCAKPYQAKYQPIAEAMMKTIRVNTKLASKAIPVVAQPELKGLTTPKQVLEDQKKRSPKTK
jgi:hypothetical protein